MEYDKNNPFLAKLTERRDLNKEGSQKETKHFVVDIEGSGITYECGDSLGVYPTNDPAAAEQLLQVLGFSGNELVTAPRAKEEAPIRQVFINDVSLAGPQKKFLKTLLGKVSDPAEKEKLTTLLEGDSDVLKSYLENHEFADLLEEFPSATFEPQEFVKELRRLMPRLYSIASSPLVHPTEVHLTVAVVRYETNNRQRIGVASTFLADRVAEGSAVVPVYVAKSHFAPPADKSIDMIMVGPGTGIAPFRSFVQEQIAREGTGRSWVFFGDQRRAYDYLYEEEWETYLAEGKVARVDLAFSRDQEQKIYVQDKMLEAGAELWEWLENGASFFICGDASRMAKDVDNALHTIVAEHGNMSPEDAAAYVKQLRSDKRYQKDVY